MLNRRRAVAAGAAATLFAGTATAAPKEGSQMYGLISQITAAPGKRDELARILLEGSRGMPGCLSYVIAADASRDDAIWVTEVWADKADHAKSPQLPQVQAAIAKGRAMITGAPVRVETAPVGGAGLPSWPASGKTPRCK